MALVYVFPLTPGSIHAQLAGLDYKGELNGHSYYLSRTPLSWHAAKASAEAVGGYLVVTSSAEEESFIREIARNSGNSVWLGYTDEEEEGVFTWEMDEGSSYSDWKNNQPDNSGGNEHYTALTQSFDWNWNDWPESGPCLYIVEFPYFQFTANTGDSYPVLVLSAQINGVDLEPGDEIGVFTPNGLGAGAVHWKGESTGLAVWKDDSQTTEVDGFLDGQPMKFRIWDRSEGEMLEVEEPEFEQGDGNFGDGASAVVHLKYGSNGCGDGDVDGDGLITSGDAILILRIATGLMQPTAQQRIDADVDCDKEITSGDAILTLRKAAGLISSFR